MVCFHVMDVYIYVLWSQPADRPCRGCDQRRLAVNSLFVSPRQIETPPADLTPSPSLTQTLQLLQDVLACHGASVVPIGDKIEDIRQVRFHSEPFPALQRYAPVSSQSCLLGLGSIMLNCRRMLLCGNVMW